MATHEEHEEEIRFKKKEEFLSTDLADLHRFLLQYFYFVPKFK
jgi:hypothetical protein